MMNKTDPIWKKVTKMYNELGRYRIKVIRGEK